MKNWGEFKWQAIFKDSNEAFAGLGFKGTVDHLLKCKVDENLFSKLPSAFTAEEFIRRFEWIYDEKTKIFHKILK